MKKNLLRSTILALLIVANSALAGSLGPGPWSNGAYYQGQFDGTYTATVYAPPEIQPDGTYFGTIISGVVGFALTGGSPRTIGDPPAWDDTKNFYAIFANGVTYTGLTLANVNINAKEVSGAFQPSQYTDSTGGSFDFYGGGFTADIDSDQAVFTFSGEGVLAAGAILGGTPATATGGAQFEIYGIKVAN